MSPNEPTRAGSKPRAAARPAALGKPKAKGLPPGFERRRPALGRRLTRLLSVVFALFALLAINSGYLAGVSLLEWSSGQTYQNWFYMNMFLVHLALGALIVIPVIVFGAWHIRNTYDRPNRRAVMVGYATFATALLLLGSGIVLTRLEGVIVVKDPTIRTIAYWMHVITPVLLAWLFVLHRLAGKKIRWRVGRRWATVAVVFGGIMLVWQTQDPRAWNVEGPASGEQYFFPSLARTATGDFIPEDVLMNDAYCQECHQDTHESWAVSAHRFSSFNNPAYLFSVRETRRVALERSGNVQAARFCAGCHDPVVFFSGKFDDPDFDDIADPAGQAGITCTACHAITHINSVRGNSDYTIEEPIHYPFAFSESGPLRWLNRQLVKAKPELHKKTFLKPLHRSPEYCGSCHKVHLPEELNDYKFLRGQNHYDAYHLSGVSGHGVTSFYYPPVAQENCNGCHMPSRDSGQFGARDLDGDPGLEIHDHQFPSANTGVPHIVGLDPEVNERHAEFNDGVMRVDLFGLRRGGRIDGELLAPLRPELPRLERGETYLLETVVRTLKMGHLFTQGTADSNQVWLDIRVTAPVASEGGEAIETPIGRSGGLGKQNRVDPWSHFLNVYMLDRDGNRIDRRNAQDIFVPLYNHQVPPGAADTIHYRLHVPETVSGPLTVEARLYYRKFDTTYMQQVASLLDGVPEGEDYVNDLPILLLARDVVTLPVRGVDAPGGTTEQATGIPEWQRWNDYGIGLLRKGGKSKGELRQAEEAFRWVEALGRPEGPLNLARVYLAQGTVRDEAIEALRRAAEFDPPAPPWTVTWFTGRVNQQNGFLDQAIADFRSIVELDNEETRRRGFDFSQDYRLRNALGQALFERAKTERGESRAEARQQLLERAEGEFRQALGLDPENTTALYNLDLVLRRLGRDDEATEYRQLYLRYKPDDNARDRAVALARARDPAANHAAEAIVIYDLHRPDAYELGENRRRATPYELPTPSVRSALEADRAAIVDTPRPVSPSTASTGARAADATRAAEISGAAGIPVAAETSGAAESPALLRGRTPKSGPQEPRP